MGKKRRSRTKAGGAALPPGLVPPATATNGFGQSGSPGVIEIAKLIVGRKLAGHFMNATGPFYQAAKVLAARIFAANPSVQQVAFLITYRNGRFSVYSTAALVPTALTSVRGTQFLGNLWYKIKPGPVRYNRGAGLGCRYFAPPNLVRTGVARRLGLPVP